MSESENLYEDAVPKQVRPCSHLFQIIQVYSLQECIRQQFYYYIKKSREINNLDGIRLKLVRIIDALLYLKVMILQFFGIIFFFVLLPCWYFVLFVQFFCIITVLVSILFNLFI